jgi:hypothetical protein
LLKLLNWTKTLALLGHVIPRANQKLGAPGAAPESDKNIGSGPGASNPTTGSDNKPTNRRSAPSKQKR